MTTLVSVTGEADLIQSAGRVVFVEVCIFDLIYEIQFIRRNPSFGFT
jgi:hypothetical protein